MPKGDKYKGKADPEDGTTPVSHLLLEAVARAKLTGLEKGALLYLWRRTYGWLIHGKRLKKRIIPLSKWAKALNTSPSQASRVLSGLAHKHIIHRTELGSWQGYEYSMNTNVGQWDSGSIDADWFAELTTVVPDATIDEGATVDQNSKDTVVPDARVTVVPDATPPATNLASPKSSNKETVKKETTTKTSTEDSLFCRLLDILQGLPEWAPEESDRRWLSEFLREFCLTESAMKGFYDYYDEKPGGSSKGVWKTRLRRWMKTEHEYLERNEAKTSRSTIPKQFKDHTSDELAEGWGR